MGMPVAPPKHPPQPRPTAEQLKAEKEGKPIEARPDFAEKAAKRLREALTKISAAAPTSTRSVLDCFYNLITTKPALISDRDSYFPRKPVFHPVNRERVQVINPNKDNIVVALFGAAVLGMYDLAEAEQGLKNAEEIHAYEALVVEREKRINLIEIIAKYGLDDFRVDGSDGAGYTLVRRERKLYVPPAPSPAIERGEEVEYELPDEIDYAPYPVTDAD